MDYEAIDIAWVMAHGGEDAERLRLKYHGDEALMAAITQIDCRRRTARKLPGLLRCERFMFPSTLAAEQCTSEALAAFHATLIAPGARVVDLTCGLGVDAFTLARRADRLTALDIDREKVCCARHNIAVLGLENIEAVEADCMAWVPQHRDALQGATVMVDPARRAEGGRRVHGLRDCSPDLTALLPLLRDAGAERVVLKMSPMLDIQHTIHELEGYATDIYAVGSPTECKELVAVLELQAPRRMPADVAIHAVTLPQGEPYSFRLDDERTAEVEYATPQPGDKLLLPYPSTLKAGALKLPATLPGVAKISADTHIYIYRGDGECEGFPGETRRVLEVLPFDKRGIAAVRKRFPRINVATRGMGLTPDELRRRLGVKEGGDRRLIGIRDTSGKRLMIIT